MKRIAIILLGSLFVPIIATAAVGVSINVGKIRIDQDMKPGIIYKLPSITVSNNGDEPSDYMALVQYHTDQENIPDMGLRPAAEWFTFEPRTFYLEPGQNQAVEITLNLPVNAKPGKYFVYLEGRPIKKVETREVTIGVAAAAKLWFTLVPANIWQGIYYRALSLYALYTFWVNLIAGIIITVIVAALIKKFFAFNISFKKTNSKESPAASQATIVKTARNKRKKTKDVDNTV